MCRHEKPENNELSKQNIQDRYYGRNDPVAKKILTGFADSQGLQPPEDTTIVRPSISHLFSGIRLISFLFEKMSLFLSSLPTSATELTIRTRVATSLPSLDPSKIKSIVHVAKSRCAFVNFTDRASAELAAQAWAAGLDFDGDRVNVKWGRGRNKAASSSASSSTAPPVSTSETVVASS